MGMTFKFGELDAILADVSHIPSASRSAFAARLKNLHRLGFPSAVQQHGRGKAITYSVGDLVEMAVAIEMAQFGLTPERAIDVLESDRYPMLMALMMGARAAREEPGDTFWKPRVAGHKNPLSMYLFFDPAVLGSWKYEGEEDWASATFFYGGEGVVRDYFTRWTSINSTRLSLINVTFLLWSIARETKDREAFLSEVEEWADAETRKGDLDLDSRLEGPIKVKIRDAVLAADTADDEPVSVADLIAEYDLQGWIDGGVLTYVEGDGPEPDIMIRLPGQRELRVSTAFAVGERQSIEAINDRVAYLQTRPFLTQFSDNTKFTVMFIQQRDFIPAIKRNPLLWGDAYERGVIMVTPKAVEGLMFAVSELWTASGETIPFDSTGADNGDR